MTYVECKEFTKYFLKNFKSSNALKEVGRFILTIISLIIIGIVIAVLLYYSWWNVITIVGVILLSFYISMVWLDWKYPK
tara:strand:- start:905 stop:1141 length:237 start_codon:yes stop_codon:yes gene_type:complete